MNDKAPIEEKTTLAAYLAIHHHKSNLARSIMFVSPRVRLILSYVLINMRQETDKTIECVYHRSVISQCQLKVEQIIEQNEEGILPDYEAEQMVAGYEKVATLSHGKLMELANA